MSTPARRPTALIAEDEPILAAALEIVLREAWPELDAITVVHDGVAAVERALAGTPTWCSSTSGCRATTGSRLRR